MTSINNIAISVIIPVYNTEQYVKAAIDSISNQSLKDIEIIVINDGSTDDSLSVINQCAQKDSRIKVISQNNQGQSAARNNGLKIAIGRYLYFMDSDDLLDIDALEICYNTCEEKNLDFVTFDADVFTEVNCADLFSISYNRKASLQSDIVIDGATALNQQIISYTYTPSPCLYLISREYMFHNNFTFAEGIIHEDELFTAKLYLFAKKISYIPTSFFKRLIRGNSTMTKSVSMFNINSYIYVAKQLIEQKVNLDVTKQKIIDSLLSMMLNAAFRKAYTLPLSQRMSILQQSLSAPLARYITIKTRAILLLKKHIKTSNG